MIFLRFLVNAAAAEKRGFTKAHCLRFTVHGLRFL